MISNLRLGWLLSYIATASISAAVITPALPLIEQQFHLAQGAIEWMISAFLIGYVIGQLVYGPLANRFGRLTALRIGLIINLGGIAICFAGIANASYSLLILGRFISALGSASGLVCTFMLINEWLDESQRKTAMAYSILSFTLGIGIAVTLGGLVTDYWQWQACFVLLFIHGVVMLLGVGTLKETLTQSKPIHPQAILSGYLQVLSSKPLIIFAMVVGFCSAIGYCYSAAAPQIADQLLHLSAAQYGLWNLINMIGMLAGGLWSKRLLAQLSPYQVIKRGFIGCSVGIISLIIMQQSHQYSPLWFFISSMLLYWFSGLLFAGGSYLASSSVSDKGNGSAMMSFINMSTATLSVVIMGYLNGNPLLAFIEILAALWIIMAALAFWQINRG